MFRTRSANHLLLMLVALVVTVTACGSSQATKPPIGAKTTDTAIRGATRIPPLQVADVSLPNVSDGGAPMSMSPPRGQLRLVYFGYTSCPDVCPTTLSDIRMALTKLPKTLADRVTVAMATVDPERDTDKRLTQYLGSFFDHPIALRTENSPELQTAADAFGVQYEIAPHQPGEEYEVSHSAFTYVVDATGTVVVEWPFGFQFRDMAHDLTTLLQKDNQ